MTLPVFQQKPLAPRSKVTSYGEPISPTEALRGLVKQPAGTSFVVDDEAGRHRVSVAANRLGIDIVTRKDHEIGKFRIALKQK